MAQLRVLDLGCHDGFVTNYIARQLPAGALHVDGVEANECGVKVATEHAARDGLSGEYKVGLAEDAPDLFDEHSYDAVVAFEIIEHVADVDRFLAACERMCKPDGRVYISTPDGTFGEGNNPHHLRVYRATDLFDAMRRRGEVADMIVGPDTISVVSYVPKPERLAGLELVIYCGPGWERWSPMDIESKGLGGSETAAVRLAEALSEKGHTVTVYGEVDQCAYKQVSFRHHSSFDPSRWCDGLIVSRIPQMGAVHVNTVRKVLWMHDTDYGPALGPVEAAGFDAIFTLSHWHRSHVLSTYPWLNEGPRPVLVTANGIVPDYFKGEQPLRNSKRAIYSSSPDRGLDFLLEIWPQVRFHVPDAELAFCYATVYDKVAETVPEIRAFREKIRHLSEQPGVVNMGSLTQPQLAREMQSSGVWLAPSWSTPSGCRFHETFCIGAVEAAAAGCRRVMSGWGALEERDEDYDNSVWLGHGSHDTPPDPEEWVAAIVEMLTADGEHTPSPAALDTEWECTADDMLRVLAPVSVG